MSERFLKYETEDVKNGNLSGVNSNGVLKSTGEAIPIPQTASVGQVLAVKAVDENGKPTEWEPRDVADQKSIVDDVLAALPTWEGGSY